MIKIAKNKREKRHKTRDVNHARIKAYILKVLQESNGEVIPSNIMIAKALGLTEQTVKKHFAALRFEPVVHPLRVLTDEVIYNIYKLSATNSASQKLWLQVMEGWSESLDVKVVEVPSIIVKKAGRKDEENDAVEPT
jgi:predicted transcriptional regulator